MAARKKGNVFLVGAGPGDEGLITLKGAWLVSEADAILYDRLVNKNILKFAKKGVSKLFAGKLPGRAEALQKNIESTMLALARRGKNVVRLKGGDPVVFGRGAEECAVLKKAGIKFEIVPGVTAGIAAHAYAGIPVTRRGDTSAAVFVTGHEDAKKKSPGVDWALLAKLNATLVIYMGVGNLARITARLIQAGMRRTTPAALIEEGTYPFQRSIFGKLSDIARKAAAAKIQPPAVCVIGTVAAVKQRVAWFEK